MQTTHDPQECSSIRGTCIREHAGAHFSRELTLTRLLSPDSAETPSEPENFRGSDVGLPK